MRGKNVVKHSMITSQMLHEGSMTSYRAQCLAITQEGLDIDQTFEISYNIL